MSAEPIKSPQPICEECWVKAHAQWEPHSMDNNGNILMKLKDVDVPHKYNLGTVEVCSECGKITVAGIFDVPPRPKFSFGVETLPETEAGEDERP